MQPEPMLRNLSEAVLNYENSGMGIMELSHRDAGGPIHKVMDETEHLMRDLLSVPDTHEVLFMHGGAWGQFSAVPFNLIDPARHKCTSWVLTGNWGKIAQDGSAPHAPLHQAAATTRCEATGVIGAPSPETWQLRPDAAFVHLTANETVSGIEVLYDPDLAAAARAQQQQAVSDDVCGFGQAPPAFDLGAHPPPLVVPPPLVADFTSTLLSRPVDISKYGIVYASGGKNVGPSGVTVAMVDKRLLADRVPHPLCPAVLNYGRVASNQSRLNTPATLNLFALLEVLRWLESGGGVAAAEGWAKQRSGAVYDTIDTSCGFYTNHVEAGSRSRINVPFRIPNRKARGHAAVSGSVSTDADAENDGCPYDLELEARFVAEATAAGIHQCHVALPAALLGPGSPEAKHGGGLRLSMYNAMPVDAAYQASKFLDSFREKHQ